MSLVKTHVKTLYKLFDSGDHDRISLTLTAEIVDSSLRRQLVGYPSTTLPIIYSDVFLRGFEGVPARPSRLATAEHRFGGLPSLTSGTCMRLPHDTWVEDHFWIAAMSATFVPLMGLFNSLIFIPPRYAAILRQVHASTYPMRNSRKSNIDDEDADVSLRQDVGEHGV